MRVFYSRDLVSKQIYVLKTIGFALAALLAMAYWNFFWELSRYNPLQDFFSVIWWNQAIHKIVHPALALVVLIEFSLFEKYRNRLSAAGRWSYCFLLGLATAFFAAQLIIRF